jgi:hypothetical protein
MMLVRMPSTCGWLPGSLCVRLWCSIVVLGNQMLDTGPENITLNTRV